MKVKSTKHTWRKTYKYTRMKVGKKKHICIKENDKERKGSKKYIKSDKGRKGIRHQKERYNSELKQ